MPPTSRFQRSKQPETAEEVFRICDLDLHAHVVTVLSEALDVAPDDVPPEFIAAAYDRIKLAFIAPDSEALRQHHSDLARSMIERGFDFESYAKDHQLFQTLMLGSLLERTSWFLGLGEKGAGVFLQAMNGELMGVMRAFDTIAAEKQAEARKAREQRLQDSLGAVVRGAQDGDLSHRVSGDLDDPVLTAIGADLNTLMETLGGGLRSAMQALDDLAKGRLNARMKGTFAGDFAALQGNIASSVAAIDTVLSRIRTASERITLTSDALLDQASGLRDRSSAEQSNLGILTERAGGLRDALWANRQAADQAGATLAVISSEAAAADAGFRDLTQTMSQIETGSEAIQKVTDLIDTIAHQTHLLSLNAAVEAARAGESGRGFAVVATEVRALATRVADGADEIRSLVSENAEQVIEGRRRTNSTSEVLTRLQQQMDNIRSVFDDIIAKNEAQAEQFGVMETTMEAMSQSMQRNAEASREGVTLSQSLAQATQDLSDVVERFEDHGTPIETEKRAGGGEATTMIA